MTLLTVYTCTIVDGAIQAHLHHGNVAQKCPRAI